MDQNSPFGETNEDERIRSGQSLPPDQPRLAFRANLVISLLTQNMTKCNTKHNEGRIERTNLFFKK